MNVQGYSESLQLYSKGLTIKSCKLFEYPCTSKSTADYETFTMLGTDLRQVLVRLDSGV